MTASAKGLLRVLHLTAPAPFGGLETVVENLTAALPAHLVRSTVVAVVGPGEAHHPFLLRLREREISTIPVLVSPRNYPSEFRAVARIARDMEADVIHSHGHRSDLMAALVGWRSRRPLVSTLHGFIGRGRGGRFREALQLHALRRFGAVVGVSTPIVARAAAAGIAPGRIHLVPNGWAPTSPPLSRVEARARLGLPEEGFVAGWVGRLSHEKGADVMLEAAALAGPDTGTWSIIGDGPERSALEGSSRHLGLESRVRWHGPRADAPQLMHAFDVLVLSSRTEGTPMVLFEAMSAGTPIVASAVGGVPAVVDSETALLTPPESPVDIVSAIRQIQADPAAARGRAERAASRLRDQFSVGPWAGRYAAIYRSLITSGPTG